MIKVSNIHLAAGRTPILHGIDVEVHPGEMLAVIGTNGAGKSTLLKAIGGELRPQRGDIHINGQPLAAWSQEALACTRGILSQMIPLTFSMRVQEVVELGRFPYQKQESAEKARQLAQACLAQVGMEAFWQRDMHTLSGGEQQRVHFARVLAQIHQPEVLSPKYLLLDEPLASLDIAQKHKLLRLVRQLVHTCHYGVFMVLHDINLAAQYADRVLMLKQGRVLALGNPREVFTPQTLKEGFDIDAHVAPHPSHACPHISVHHAEPVFQATV